MANSNAAATGVQKLLEKRIVTYDQAGRPTQETVMYSDGSSRVQAFDYNTAAPAIENAPKQQITLYDASGRPSETRTAYYNGTERVETLDYPLDEEDEDTDLSTTGSNGGAGTTTTPENKLGETDDTPVSPASTN